MQRYTLDLGHDARLEKRASGMPPAGPPHSPPYSRAFSSGTLGGSRPAPPTDRLLPITLGQMLQRVDVVSRDFDNIVELEV